MKAPRFFFAGLGALLFLLASMTTISCSSSDDEDDEDEDASGIGYFIFASDSAHVLSEDFDAVKAKAKGDLMIGGDSSYPEVSEEFDAVMAKADELGARKHVYLEGPGGPTGATGIASDECDRMRARAEKIAIAIDREDCSDGSDWLTEWNADGWWNSTIDEMAFFHAEYGAVSFEIDNLYRGGVEAPETLSAFLLKFQAAIAEGALPISLVLKNPTVADLERLSSDLAEESTSGLLPATLTPFAISEEYFQDDWPAIKAASLAIGITTLTSADTNDYQARGYFGE